MDGLMFDRERKIKLHIVAKCTVCGNVAPGNTPFESIFVCLHIIHN